MGIAEERYRDGTGERELKNGKRRCHAVSKTKVKLLRIERNDPTLRADDCWPDAQCAWPAEDGTYLCSLHGGKSLNIIKQSMAEYMPYDLQEKLKIFESNKDQLFNRDHEVGQLLAINAQLYASMDDLIIGEEGYMTIAEARKKLLAGEVVQAGVLLDIALRDVRTEREVRNEIRENIKLIDKLTITQFNIRKELKLMATVDQIKNLLEGIYKGFEKIVLVYIPDDRERSKAVHEFAGLIRELANARHVSELGNGK